MTGNLLKNLDPSSRVCDKTNVENEPKNIHLGPKNIVAREADQLCAVIVCMFVPARND